MSFDLNALPAHYIAVYGRERVGEVLGRPAKLIAMWERTKRFPLDAVSRLLEFDPAPLAAIKPLYEPMERGNKLALLVPLTGPPEPKMMDCLMKLYDPRDMWYDRFAFNNLSVSRAVLAARFLRSPSTWSFWMDSDMGVPCGDAEWFKRECGFPQMPDIYANLNAIHRALVHRQNIVSCAYVSRHIPAIPQFGGGELPEMRSLVRRGPQDRLIERPWSGMGGVLVHRKVFEDIIATQGDEIRMKPDGIGKRFNYQYAFFQPLDCESCGDDIPFLIRAGRAGHKTHIDLAIHAAHIGDRAYTYADIAAN